MALLTWTDDLSTGNAEVDSQHRKLVDLLNSLHDAMRSGQGAQDLSGIFDEVLAYTDYHFKTEERLFGPVEYPQKAEHIRQHAELVDQALGLQVQFRSGKAFMTAEVLQFLKNWIVHHIQEMDLTFKGRI
jgi:hemerythrin-like metal-binding protein